MGINKKIGIKRNNSDKLTGEQSRKERNLIFEIAYEIGYQSNDFIYEHPYANLVYDFKINSLEMQVSFGPVILYVDLRYKLLMAKANGGVDYVKECRERLLQELNEKYLEVRHTTPKYDYENTLKNSNRD